MSYLQALNVVTRLINELQVLRLTISGGMVGYPAYTNEEILAMEVIGAACQQAQNGGQMDV